MWGGRFEIVSQRYHCNTAFSVLQCLTLHLSTVPHRYLNKFERCVLILRQLQAFNVEGGYAVNFGA